MALFLCRILSRAASFSPFWILSGCGCKFCHVRLFKVIQAEPSDIQSVVFWHKKPILLPHPLKSVLLSEQDVQCYGSHYNRLLYNIRRG